MAKRGRRASRRKSKKTYAELQQEISAREKPRDLTRRIKEDLLKDIEADFNELIQTTITDLTSDASQGGWSPVLTGFFASNWKAGTIPPKRDQIPQGTEWAKIKTITRKRGNKTETVLAVGQKPLIKQRHVVPAFSIKDTVYIGSAAKYAPYALMSPKSKLIAYIAGGGGGTVNLDQRVKGIMADVRIGADVEGGFINRMRSRYEPGVFGFRPRTGYTKTKGSST